MNEYVRRINAIMDFIEDNLSSDLVLEKLAREAAFSPFHFHRIFSSIAGEPLYQFILRHRLEHAVRLMADRSLSLTRIALDCGFSQSSTFSRAFKEKYGITPTQLRRERQGIQDSKDCQNPGNNRKERIDRLGYVEYRPGGQIWKGGDIERIVSIRAMEEIKVAYIRHVGPYQGDSDLFRSLWKKFCFWAGPRGYLSAEGVRSFSFYHNDPSVTEKPKLRLSLGVSVPKSEMGSGEIGVMKLKAGEYATCDFQLGPRDYQGAWDWFYGSWLPISGYIPADGLAFEEYFQNDEKKKNAQTQRVRLGIPVKPME